MLKQIDHVVVLVRDLAAASADFAHAGFTVTAGGEHAGGATHNALIALGDGAYFELIAFTEPERPQTHRWWPRLTQGEGFVDYALLSDDLASDAEAFRQRGLAVRGPEEGGRKRPDGAVLRWRSLLLGRGVGHPALPFVIEDLTPRVRRVPDGAAKRHELAVTSLEEVMVVVADLVAAATAFTALLGDPPLERERTPDGQVVRYRLGTQRIALLRPGDGTSAARHLAARGDGLYAVTLTTEGGAAAEATLPPNRTHGALVRLAH